MGQKGDEILVKDKLGETEKPLKVQFFIKNILSLTDI